MKMDLITEEQAKNGIELKVTQNDLISLLVEEQITDINNQIKILNDKFRVIRVDIENAVKETITNICIKKTKEIHQDLEYDNYSNNTSLYHNCKRIDISHINGENSIIKGSSSNFINKFNKTLNIAVDATLNKTNITYSFNEKVNFKLNNKILAKITKYNIELDFFLKKYENYDFNEKTLTRKLKNQFTKEFIKKTPTSFKKALQQKFTLTE